MLGKKWKPAYLTDKPKQRPSGRSQVEQTCRDVQDHSEKKKTKPQLSTKGMNRPFPSPPRSHSHLVLADVVESTIGAAYEHGGVSLGYEACKFFKLNIDTWEPVNIRYDQMLKHVKDAEFDVHALPHTEIHQLEKLIGYTFHHKFLAVEALTHASHQQYFGTTSYERLELLGDSVLDMIVTDYLYHAPGKNYSPGHIHLRKSAVVNAHTLAYVSLDTTIQIEAIMPRPDENGKIAVNTEVIDIPLYKCLLHSSSYIFDTQESTAARFKRRKADITQILQKGLHFPWAALTHLQAPKYFSDMVESTIGAAFLDSKGDFDVAKGVMRKLGLWQILERIVEDNVDVLHPVSLVSLWASKHERDVEYEYPKEKGNISCIVKVDGEIIHEETTIYTGRVSKDEVRFAAAEATIQKLGLRDINFGRGSMKTKARRKTTRNKKSCV
jgi:endoribonuclease Dicer